MARQQTLNERIAERRPLLDALIDAWARKWLDDPKEPRHPAYRGYILLKVAAVTDDLRDLVAAIAGFDDGSDELLAVGYLVREWRDRNYAYKPDGARLSFNKFLVDFDLQHRLRRVTFLRRRVNDLYLLNGASNRVIKAATGKSIAAHTGTDELFREHFRAELRHVKRDLSRILVQLRLLGRNLHAQDSTLANQLFDFEITRDLLRHVIQPGSDQERRTRAAEIVGDGPRFGRLADEFARCLKDGLRPKPDDLAPIHLKDNYGTVEASADLREALAEGGPAKQVLVAYASCFDDFDMVAFPMLYGTDAGETDVVEIVRVAPEDAKSIIDERDSKFTIRKTHGWKYNHFGAFLSKDWRQNDILFGRLDAAECLINALVPERNPDRAVLRQQAQAAIILETLDGEQRLNIFGPDVAALTDSQLLDAYSARIVGWFQRDFKDNYEDRSDLPPQKSLPVLARGVEMSGKVLNGIANQPGALKKVTGWVARIGSMLTGIVSLGMPGSGYGAVFRHIWPLLIAFELVMVGVGRLFDSSAMIGTGIMALILTLLVGALAVSVARLLRGGRFPLRVSKKILVRVVVGVLLVAAAAGLGHGWTNLSQYRKDLVSLYDHIKPILPWVDSKG